MPWVTLLLRIFGSLVSSLQLLRWLSGVGSFAGIWKTLKLVVGKFGFGMLAMPKIPIKALLIGLALAAPFVGYGWGYVVGKADGRIMEREAAEKRIAAMVKKINDDAEQKIEEAKKAASEVSPTPEIPEEIAALCAKDAACRDRNQ